jgi:hypothetical protein
VLMVRHFTFLSASKHCLDVGCGVGGPMRNVARYSQGDV